MYYRMSILTFQVCIFYDLFINNITKYILYASSTYAFPENETDISKLTALHQDTVFWNKGGLIPNWAGTDQLSTYPQKA